METTTMKAIHVVRGIYLHSGLIRAAAHKSSSDSGGKCEYLEEMGEEEEELN